MKIEVLAAAAYGTPVKVKFYDCFAQSVLAFRDGVQRKVAKDKVFADDIVDCFETCVDRTIARFLFGNGAVVGF